MSVLTGMQTRRGGGGTITARHLSTRRALFVALSLAAGPSLASPRPPVDPVAVALTLPSRARITSGWLRPHLDRTRALVGADRARAANGLALTGRGVVIGLVDSGVDLAHPDLRAPDGATRVAWMLDYAAPPLGLHPALEARFAVDTPLGRRGAVLSRDDLDARIRSNNAPGDVVGHGTHALSIALGDSPAHRYVGMAPGATAVVVRASLRADRAEVPEALAALGAEFVFDRADALAMPAVVTLSLGTHHGAHDGDGTLERSLARLTDDGRSPARAIVTSAGNGGGRALHAHVELTRGATVPLSLRLAGAYAGAVGISLAYTDALSIAPAWPDGTLGERVPTGLSITARHPVEGSRISVTNAPDGASPVTAARVADVLFEAPGGVYTLWLRGEGRVDAWLYLDGNASELPVFLPPYGDTLSTVEMPATSASVIAVGALTTRTQWVDARGTPASRIGAIEGTVAPFSARGPSRIGALRPDLVAPGDVVIAALSAQASASLTGPFADPTLAVDATHAVASGTSAAAPHVAGALALLFEESPRATQRELAAALTAGESLWNPSRGWGELDVVRALAALHASSQNTAIASRSACSLPTRLTLGERAVIPCRALDANGSPAAAPLALMATAGTVEAPVYLGLGRYALGYTAPRDAARATLTVTLDGAHLTHADVTFSAGPGTDNVTALGGCSTTPARTSSTALIALLAILTARSALTRRARGARPA